MFLLSDTGHPSAEGDVNTSYALILLNYCFLHGHHIVIFAVLSAMAAFRRELSSNRVYMEHNEVAVRRESSDEADGDNSSKDSLKKARRARRRLVILDQDAADLEHMLEGAGNVYGPLFALVLAVRARVTLTRAESRSGAEAGGIVRGTTALTNCASVQAGGASPNSGEDSSMGAMSVGKDSRYFSNARDGSESGNSGDVKTDNGRSEDGEQISSNKLNSQKGNDELSSVSVLNLPQDSHIHILSFLHPRDVVTFACTSKGARFIVDDETVGECGDSTSLLLWKELWKRDYAWIISEWDVGQEALIRSMGQTGDIDLSKRKSRFQRMSSVFKHLESSMVENSIDEEDLLPCSDRKYDLTFGDSDEVKATHLSMKDFYFIFGQTWMNYTLAGQSTSSRCLVGLHGHVYDITNFYEQHPGSPETLLVQSGRDATGFFEDLGHSVGARKMAMTMCIILDRSCVVGANNGKGCGLLRTGEKSSTKTPSERKLPKASWARTKTARNSIPMARSKPRRPGNLCRVRSKLDREERRAQIEAEKWLSRTLTRDGILGNIHVYYDAFVGRWMLWYTDLEFQPVYVDHILTGV